ISRGQFAAPRGASSGACENTRSKYNAATKTDLQYSQKKRCHDICRANEGGYPDSGNMAALAISVAIQNEFGQECDTCLGSLAQDRQNGPSSCARQTAGFELPVVNPN